MNILTATKFKLSDTSDESPEAVKASLSGAVEIVREIGAALTEAGILDPDEAQSPVEIVTAVRFALGQLKKAQQ